jgi:heat shock protein HslJ
MRQVVFVLLAVMGVAGCAAQPVQGAAQDSAGSHVATADALASANLQGTEWRFIEIGGTAVPDDVVATLRLRGNRASGKAGCNSYGASWQMTADGGTRFGEMMSTKMACLETSRRDASGTRRFQCAAENGTAAPRRRQSRDAGCLRQAACEVGARRLAVSRYW